MPTQPSKHLDTFDNPSPERDYTIRIRIPEFTCLCPKTGQPDFATLYLDYVPDRKCVELKSLKLYIWSFRNEGAFHEAVTNSILNDLVAATAPRYMRLRAKFYVRGGIYTTVVVDYRKPGWSPPFPPPGFGPGPEPPPEPQPPAPESPESPESPQTPSTRTARTAESPPPSPPASTRSTPPAAAAAPPPAHTRSPGEPATDTGRPAGRFRMLPRERRAPASVGKTTEPQSEPQQDLAAGDRPASTPAESGSGAAARKAATDDPIYLGIDFGTTGCRAVAINAQGGLLAQSEAPIPAPARLEGGITQDPASWWTAASSALSQLTKHIEPARVRAIAVDGTSGTVLLCDRKGTPVTEALMYNDARAVDQASRILPLAGSSTGVQGATSSLAKLLWLSEMVATRHAAHAVHQADWISGKLTGVWGHSDYNNCLKLGYDVESGQWPEWIGSLSIDIRILPKVHAPGEPIAQVSAAIAKEFGFARDAVVVAGTTDGVAAFLAAGGSENGDAVTSLGSTLILKMLSDRPVFSAGHGVYSHRLGNRWLIGGASNSGGATLLQYFSVEQMREMIPLLHPEKPTGLDYYPLPDVGERFPVNDPAMTAKLEPLPSDSTTFFQGMLEGIAHIEDQGYRLLHALGGPKVRAVRTTGGGSHNEAWQRIRKQILGIPMIRPRSELPAFGSALLAAGTWEDTA